MVAIELKPLLEKLQEQQEQIEALTREKIHAVKRFEEQTTELRATRAALKDAQSRAA